MLSFSKNIKLALRFYRVSLQILLNNDTAETKI